VIAGLAADRTRVLHFLSGTMRDVEVLDIADSA